MGNKKVSSHNNVWNKEGFQMCGLGEKSKIIAKIKYIRKCIRWSFQRITRGYSDYDKKFMFRYLQHLLPDMLQDMRNKRSASPGYLGKNYTNEEGILVNDTCREEWDRILDHMIFLWKESNEYTCSKMNFYQEEYDKASAEFTEKYGFWGIGLQTRKEREEMLRPGGTVRIYFMHDLPEYKEISDKYDEEKDKIKKYREQCKDEALELLKEHFFALWG